MASTRFREKYKNLFKGYSFNFKDLELKTAAAFIKIVKDLGAEVTQDAPYVFTDKVTNEIKEYKYYNLLYLLHSVQQNKALDIELYRLSLTNHSKCPHGSMNCYYANLEANFQTNDPQSSRLHSINNIFCESCLNEHEKNVKNTESNKFKIINELIHNPAQLLNDDLDEPPKKYKKLNYSDQNKDILMSLSVEKTTSKNNNLNLNSVQNVNTKESTNLASSLKLLANPMFKAKKGVQKTIDKVDNSTNNSNSSNNNDSSEFLSDFESEEDENNDNLNEWWKPHIVPDHMKCKIYLCTFDPTPHKCHSKPTYKLSLFECQILLKYIIQTNSLSRCRGNKLFSEMIQKGYLKHRSAETLRNCLRRRVIPNLRNYMLPKHIEQDFFNEFGIK